MNHAPFIVTVDGPAASGKSSVSRQVARRMGWSWVSTGAFYRGIAYIARRQGYDLSDEDELVRLAQSPSWSVRLTDEQTCVYLGDENVTEDIGREEIGSLASQVSSLPKLRKALLDAQRQCALGVDGLVAEGRDCGTVVFPQAQMKFFLTARAEDRAARRARDEGQDVERTIDEQKRRDSLDANRRVAPMQASVDSCTIDTTDLSLDEVVRRVEALIRARMTASQHSSD